MNVLVTGPYGRCGTALVDHLHDDPAYEFTYLNRSDRPADDPYGGYDTHVADVADYEAVRSAFDGQDAVVHLAAYPYTSASRAASRTLYVPTTFGSRTSRQLPSV